MSPRPLARLAPAGLLAACAVLLVRAPAPGCAPVFRSGQSVRIASETALIIWDDKRPRDGKKGTEHFIRRATFDTLSPDFGFLVPTPTKPDVHKAPDEVFVKLEELTRPKIVERKVTGPPPGMMRGGAVGLKATAPGPTVEVVGAGRVDSLDYVTLRFATNDPKPVLDWLKQHGYSTRDALDEWLVPYLEKGWYLTAFKLASPNERLRGFSTAAVRLTFGTDRPFYPYREPADMRSPGAYLPHRLLRLYVLADKRVGGTLNEEAWRAQTVWADNLVAEQVKGSNGLLDALNVTVEREGEWSPWLTMFHDDVSPRYGIDEVYFETSADQTAVERIEYRDVYGPPPEIALPEETRSRLVVGMSILAGALLLGLGGIALYFFLSARGEGPA